jgi:hypothetical protein
VVGMPFAPPEIDVKVRVRGAIDASLMVRGPAQKVLESKASD